MQISIRSVTFVVAMSFGVLLMTSCSGVNTREGEPAHIVATPDTRAPDTKQSDPPTGLYAGAHAVDMTPEIGTPLAGFGGGDRRELDLSKLNDWLTVGCIDDDITTPYTYFNPSVGVRDPIRAKALALRDGGEIFVIVGLDTIGTTQDLVDDVAKDLESDGIKKANIIITATHTHSGPGAVGKRHIWSLIAADCFNPRIYTALKSKVVEAIRGAVAALAPAKLGVRRGELLGVAHNRRGEPGNVDTTLAVIHVKHRDGRPLATLINFAVHPIAFGDSNMHFSADIAGMAERHFQQKIGGVAIFINGAEGDSSPDAKRESGNLKMGLMISNRAQELLPTTYAPTMYLETARTIKDFGRALVVVDCQTLGQPSDCTPLVIDREFDETFIATKMPMSAMLIGDMLIVGIPGEATFLQGQAIRKALKAKGFDDVLIFGLANGHMGYITTAEQYKAGGYEATATLYGSKTGKNLLDGVLEVVEKLKGKQK